MAVPTEDEDERFSLPSTMATDQELKIQSLEAQLALLSKQMQTLLAGKVPAPVAPAESSDSSPLLSDDEGKGASLCSPSDTVTFPVGSRGGMAPSKLAVPPPPPPPPPPSLLTTSSTSVSRANTPSSKVSFGHFLLDNIIYEQRANQAQSDGIFIARFKNFALFHFYVT
ncbi:hypothetical protein TELCIR_22325 [Teladorsagia circumcincta]|uniref:Uncharacterized protein n=1 Tax=Teladorsagia circumcincta TaxID=45464 RepID=A0A2G9TE75_TELCI|nr:hypothetical protein TELCIR_22325 [Teladorsagia circumcincta]